MLSNEHGFVLQGRHVKSYLFKGVVTMGRLTQLAPDPALLDNPRALKTQEQQQLLVFREEIQRKLQGAKKENAKLYAHNMYYEQAETPAITLVTLNPLQTETIPVPELDATVERIMVPYGHLLLPADGDTQLAARYNNLRQHPETADDRVAIDIYHGRDTAACRQLFHDFNLYGVRMATAQALGGNGRDPVLRICRALESIPFFTARIDYKARQRLKDSPKIIILTALHNAVKCLLVGKAGISSKVIELPMPEDEATKLALQWFGALCEAIGPQIEDSSCVASGPAVFPALGILGYEWRRQDPVHWLSRVVELTHINWGIGPHWSGIAGVWDQDRRTLGTSGAKQKSHAVLSALMDGNSLGYHAIRDIRESRVVA